MKENAQKILRYLEEHSTMVLSTFGEQKGLWATPVFFVNRGFRLYFLSELKSNHSKNLRENMLAAAAVTEDYKDWKDIKGVQLQGNTYLVTGIGEIAQAMASYCKKFPAVKHMLQNPGSLKGVSQARWHCLIPHYLKYTDNAETFGRHFEMELKVRKTPEGFAYEEE